MEDRLKELRKANPEAASDEPISTDDVELGVKKGKNAEPTDESEFMNEFFQDVGSIKAAMGNIRRNIKLVEEKYVQSLTSVNIEQGNKSGSEIQQLIDTNNRLVTEVRSMLDNMKKKNQQYDAKGSTATETRIRANMHSTLTQKFLELVQEYQEVQTSYKNKYQEKIERQYKIAKPDATQSEIEDAIESGDSSKVFATQILDSHLHQQAKNALAYIEARHADIKKIEVSIKQLHELFVDMAILVDAQGEMLNQIEYNVSQSVDYIKKGNEQLVGAIKQQKKSRKKMYILICIMVVIIIVILAPTLSTVLK
jgi:t-SNARE complex subunit (syntaxin)